MASKTDSSNYEVKLLGNLSALAIISFLSSTAALADEPGWVLTQRDTELGDHYVYLSRSGLRSFNPQSGIGIAAHGPAFDVDYFNERAKLFYREPLNAWQNRKTKLEVGNWKKSQSGKIAGLKVTRYVTVPQNLKNTNWTSIECWFADEVKVPPQLALLLAKTYGVTGNACIPLRIVLKNRTGRSETVLDTYRQQTMSIPQDYYSLASGYAGTKDPGQVTTGESPVSEATVQSNSPTDSTPVTVAKPKLDLGRWRPGQPVTRAVLDKYHKYLNAYQKAKDEAEADAKEAGNQ